MEQTGSLDTHGSTGHAAPDPRTAAVRVPAQSRAPERGRERGPERGQARGRDRDVAAGASTVGAAARGEHTHSETPLPPPPVRPPGENPPTRTPSARPVVQRTSVRGQILAALRTALVEGELAPGEVYSAPVLGERFGVSATPVREAMQQLALEGAVEVVPNRGFRVVRRGTRELAELAEIRALIEVPVMLRLARTVSAARWSELRPLAEATVRAASTGCRATYAESDRAFHRAVLALAGNAQLVQIAEDLHRRAQWPLVGGPVSRGRADLVADAAEHTALLEALIVQDLPVVQSLVREHFAGA
ncbi:GntR family transcriptional regulator [Streptomyces sp. NPDC004324]